MTNINDYSVLKSTEERCYIFMIAFMTPVFICIAVFVLHYLMSKEIQHQIKLNPYGKQSLKLSIAYIILYLCLEGYVVFISNDLFFNIDIQNVKIGTINDVVLGAIYFAAKAVLYYALTYYHQSILYEYDNNHKMSKLMIVWMAMSTIIFTVTAVIFVADDAMEQTSKEIGFTKKRNIYLSVYMGHGGAPLSALAFAIVLIFDFLYFAVLIGLFVSVLRKIKNNENMNKNEIARITEKGLKALVLIVFTCVILWVNCLTIAFTLDVRWITGTIDPASDCICLYFLFVESNLYWIFFGVFHDCFGRCLYGSGYRRISNKSGYNPVEMDDIDHEAVQDAI